MSKELEHIKEHFITLIKNHIIIRTNSKEHNIEDINNLFDFLSKGEDISYFANNEIFYELNVSYYNKIILDSIGYPWNYPFNNIIAAYLNKNIEWSDVKRFMALQVSTIDKLNIIKTKEVYNLNGTPEFKSAFVDFCKLIVKECDTIFRNNKIKNFHLIDKFDNYTRATFLFENNIKYAQKKHLIKALQNAFNKRYELYQDSNIKKYSDSDIFGIFNKLIRLRFTDSTRACTPVSGFIISVKANDWHALAMEEMSQFVPKLGKHND